MNVLFLRRLSRLWPLFLLLSIAALLRLYKLDSPNLWYDEFLIIHYSSLPLQSLFNLVQQSSYELPLYSIIIKAIGLIQTSDWSFRFLSAIVGILTVYLLYKFCKEIFGDETAFIAASLLAVNPFHIFISRQIRVYALFNLFVLVVFICLSTFIKAPKRSIFFRLILVNAPLILLHRFAAYLVCAEIVILGIFSLQGRFRFWRVLTLFGVVSIFFLPVFFLSLGNPLLGTTINSPSLIPSNTEGLAVVLFTFGLPETMELLYAYCAVFFLAWMLIRRVDAEFAWTSLLFILIPFALLIPTFKAMYSPHTFIFMIFPAYSIIAAATASLLKNKSVSNVIGVVICITGCMFTVIPNYDTLYTDESRPFHGWKTENYKKVASVISSRYSKDQSQFTFSNPSFYYNVDWYLRTYNKTPSLSQPKLNDPDLPIPYHFISSYGDFGHWGKNRQEFLDKLTVPESENTFGETTIYSWTLPPDRIRFMSSSTYTYQFKSMPRPLYAESSNFSGVTLLPYWESSVIASDHDRTGFIEYEFSPENEYSHKHFKVNIFFENSGEGNILSLKYKFDAEPFQTTTISQGPDASDRKQISFTRNDPYSTLTLRFELLCTTLTPNFMGKNLESLKLKRFNVFADRNNIADNCFNAFVDLAPVGFPPNIETGNETISIENIEIIEKNAVPGWSCYTAKDKAQPGVAVVHFRKNTPGVVFYPRVNSGMVQVVEDVGKIHHEHFRLHGSGKQWSPIAAGASIALPHKQIGEDVVLRFELSGDAQLWFSNRAVFDITK